MSERTNTYFVSDLHLGAGYIDNPREHEQTIVRWLRAIAPKAKRLFLLGDILDYWYEYRTVVPRGYTRFFGALAELADQGVEITWLKGNHDIWIFDYLPKEIGLTVEDGVVRREIDGRTFVMEHGDGVGEMRWTYRAMRRLFRNRLAQWLYAAIHPRWTVGFAHRWSRHSRLNSNFVYQPEMLDDDKLLRFAEDYIKANGPVDFFVFGHRHTLVDHLLPNGTTRLIVLGEGFRQMTYGVWNGSEFKLGKMTEC